ncbi:SDR family NAD(P)-dependent oxidoreductase [Mycobacterium riyadhense]|uniref:Short-chain dehydrogenase n=1 Tax=Mycobacterium riyadhense TaxID=486698 RepID=A0A1X2CLA3_9MYCO|nr:SDR family NAD(P)-dependent oxidoreductase [Mycobacterium riyadhense]MCV7148212.1 SDR family NAD(P)-dependent oxidoreductase [Mycobacterium riyadhense]ORW76583.1 short-chain dehydrogenase [Mycobacterium riyadhense]
MQSVSGINVLVTGAAMGLGKLFATKAVKEGAAAVVLWDANEAALKETAAELEAELKAAGGTIHCETVDVTSRAGVAEAAERVRATVGTIHVLFNNAGIVRGNGYFWENQPRDFTLTMEVNSIGPMLVAREFLPAMIESGAQCRVVNIASSAGLNAIPRMAAYAASKWAAIGFSDSVRLELEQAGHEGVRVTTVCPTYINTGMFDGAKGILFTPMLKQEDVVEQTWTAMLEGRPFVVMPWTSKMNRVLSAVLPTRLRDVYLRRVGVYNSMDEFRGH